MESIKITGETGMTLLLLPDGFTPVARLGTVLMACGHGVASYVTWQVRPDGTVDNGCYFGDKEAAICSLIERGIASDPTCNTVAGLVRVSDYDS